MVTTKKTSFPSLHSDQGHGLTKVWSKQEKKQITKLQNKEGLNASKGEGGGSKGGSWKRGLILNQLTFPQKESNSLQPRLLSPLPAPHEGERLDPHQQDPLRPPWPHWRGPWVIKNTPICYLPQYSGIIVNL